MARLFISYAREDRGFVDTLATALAGARHDVWYDRDLQPGSFRAQIDTRLAESDAVIVVWSARSALSRYVHDEAERGVQRGVLLPVRIDRTALPLGFGGIETLDLSHWSGRPDTPAFESVLRQIDHISKTPASVQARPTVTFVARSMALAVILAGLCAPVLVVFNNIKRDLPTNSITTSDIAEAFALGLFCCTPVMLWCGYQVRRFGLSHLRPVLRRAASIYGISALLALSIVAVAVAAGVTTDMPPTRALAQLGFVGMVATLAIGAAIAVLRASIHFVRKLAA